MNTISTPHLCHPPMLKTAPSPSLPLVSIVIPCFNHGQFLTEAIGSALQQTYDNVEVIVVDDGSTEDIAALVRSFNGVSYLRQPNRGVSAARNRGLDNARGEFIVFLDADDRLLPNAIEAGQNCFAEHPDVAFVSGGYHQIDIGGNWISSPDPTLLGGGHYEAFLRSNYVGMHATVMYRRDILRASGGFDTGLNACEDYDVYFRLSRQYPVASHPTVIAEYRIYPTSTSRDLRRMLRGLVAVRRRQRPFIRGAKQKAAYRSGCEYWNQLYADPLAKMAAEAICEGRFRDAVSIVPTLTRHDPRFGAQVMLREILKRVFPARV